MIPTCTPHVPRMSGGLIVSLIVMVLTGCGRIVPIVPPNLQTVSIQYACDGCLRGQPIGYAPLSVSLFAAVPEGVREIAWDLGDGTSDKGRFITKTYHSEGLYKISLSAEGVVKRKRVLYQALLYVKVLGDSTEKENQSIEISNRLAAFTASGPRVLRLGERALVCLYATAKRDLVVIDFRAVESAALAADGILQNLWIYIKRASVIEHCFTVRGFRAGSGYLQFILHAADNTEGERSEGRLEISVEDKGGYDEQRRTR